jgi:hydroxyacylglutathione hydrolase
MLLKRLYDDKLAQASYLIGCEHTRVAVVVDPKRDVGLYLDAARDEALTITHVTETHIHADFVSGARDLARATGATLHLSGMGGNDWQYNATGDGDLDLLHDGSSFAVGSVRIKVMHTPGHTPEHVTFLVTDTASANVALGALTGDFIFVGDVGRPDLLERAVGRKGTMDGAARTLFKSIRQFKSLPDFLQIWPGHGAGSACGKALGAMPQSTLGYEKLFNWGLAETNEERFVEQVLAGQPDPPAYFATMKRVNKDGPPPLIPLQTKSVTAEDVAAALAGRRKLTIVDTRPADQFIAGHPRGAINIPWNRSFLTWFGSLVPESGDIVLITHENEREKRAILRDLSLIGMERVFGIFNSARFAALEKLGIPLAESRTVNVDAVDSRHHTIVDVRGDDEWEAGHIPGAVHIPLGQLARRIDELPNDGEIVVHCESGGRSFIAASLLEQRGRKAASFPGGFEEWRRSGREIIGGAEGGGS